MRELSVVWLMLRILLSPFSLHWDSALSPLSSTTVCLLLSRLHVRFSHDDVFRPLCWGVAISRSCSQFALVAVAATILQTDTVSVVSCVAELVAAVVVSVVLAAVVVVTTTAAVVAAILTSAVIAAAAPVLATAVAAIVAAIVVTPVVVVAASATVVIVVVALPVVDWSPVVDSWLPVVVEPLA